LNWSEQLKSVTVETFRKAVADKNNAAPWWFAAFGTDLPEDDGHISTTPFDMTVARQRFLADVVRLARSLGDKGEAFQETLYGPWRYADDQHSLGWDPTTMRWGAFTTEASTGMANTGVAGAVWLAFESLALFPCFCSGGKLNARGFSRSGNSFDFRWPIWDAPISIATLRSLLCCTDLYADEVPRALSARGVKSVYSSQRFKPNKYMIGFRPSILVAGAS